MILSIRTDSADATLVLADSRKVLESKTWPAGRQLSQQLLPEIEQLLARHQVQPAGLSGMVVYQGPGSFTGLRIGATVANTMAYALGIPIVGTTGEDWQSQGESALKKAQLGRYVAPEYGSEANISQPKK